MLCSAIGARDRHFGDDRSRLRRQPSIDFGRLLGNVSHVIDASCGIRAAAPPPSRSVAIVVTRLDRPRIRRAHPYAAERGKREKHEDRRRAPARAGRDTGRRPRAAVRRTASSSPSEMTNPIAPIASSVDAASIDRRAGRAPPARARCTPGNRKRSGCPKRALHPPCIDVGGGRRQVVRQRRRIEQDSSSSRSPSVVAIERVRVPVRRDHDRARRSRPGDRRANARARARRRASATDANGGDRDERGRQEDRVVDARIHLRDKRRHHQPRVAARSGVERRARNRAASAAGRSWPAARGDGSDRTGTARTRR